MRIVDGPAIEASHAFAGAAEVLGDQHGAPPAGQSFDDLASSGLRSGEYRDRGVRPADIERSPQCSAVC
jgi:hypothetical protein